MNLLIMRETIEFDDFLKHFFDESIDIEYLSGNKCRFNFCFDSFDLPLFKKAVCEFCTFTIDNRLNIDYDIFTNSEGKLVAVCSIILRK